MSNIYVAGIAMTVLAVMPSVRLRPGARSAQRLRLKMPAARPATSHRVYAGMTNGPLQSQIAIPAKWWFSKIGIEAFPFTTSRTPALRVVGFNLRRAKPQGGHHGRGSGMGAEKMNIPGQDESLLRFSSRLGCVHGRKKTTRRWSRWRSVEVPPGSESDKPYSKFMAIYAAMCRYHMKTYGTTAAADRGGAAKNHTHSVHNPYSAIPQAITIDEILASPPITYRSPCRCAPRSPTDPRRQFFAPRRPEAHRRRSKPMQSRSGQRDSQLHPSPLDQPERNIGRLPAQQSIRQAGLGPRHGCRECTNASAMGEISRPKTLASLHAGGADRGGTRRVHLGGRIPINPSGGLNPRGIRSGPTGIGQLYELVTQLPRRSRARQVQGARHAIQENARMQGVEEAAVAIHILSK